MKKRVFTLVSPVIILMGFMYGCMQQNSGYTIKGTLGDVDPGAKVYLEYYNAEGKQILDSALVTKNRFEFIGELTSPYRATLYLDRNDEGFSARNLIDRLTIYIDNENIKVKSTDSLKNAAISGSLINGDAQRWKEIVEPIDKRQEEYYAWWRGLTAEERASEENKDLSMKKSGSLSDERKAAAVDFISNNPASKFALITLFNMANGFAPDGAYAESLFNKFTPELRESEVGKKYQEKIAIWKNVSIGAVAPDFAEKDPDGKMIKLSDLRGKYVLLDFWASWCGPCRAENPHVVRAFNHYKERGFTVFGVSLDGLPSQDDARESWLKAIKDDKLEWTQVSELKGWDTESRKMYDVNGIPSNFLIGPDGKILERNLRGKALDNALEKYLGK